MNLISSIRKGGPRAAFFLCFAAISVSARAEPTLSPEAEASFGKSVFEVVVPKLDDRDPLSYSDELPLDLLPYKTRMDRYNSIGTAFCIGKNRFLSAAHVFALQDESFARAWFIRDSDGRLREVDTVYKYSNRGDFILFSVKDPEGTVPLERAPATALNSLVYTVGNALGEGVIVREGRYTSNTPEDREGAWKWLRFSAPASPGNSGGPLVDSLGRVLGIAEMRSENENYNYALPLSVVDAAPAEARLNERTNYVLPIMSDTKLGVQDVTVSLPKPIAALRDELLRANRLNSKAQLAALLSDNADSLFPVSSGSDYLLKTSIVSFFPGFAVEQSDKSWKIEYGDDQRRVTLSDTSSLAWSSWKGMDIQRYSRAENTDLRALLDDSKSAMDGVLTGLALSRTVAGKQTRITSFGAPTREARFTDRWGRVWLETEWEIPFADQVLLWYRLPTPEGFSGIMEIASVRYRTDDVIDMHAMLDFVDADYAGTYAQWREFLSLGDLVPRHLGSMSIAPGTGGGAVTVAGMAFSPSEAKFPFDGKSSLFLYCTFGKSGDGGFSYGVNALYAQTQGSRSVGAGLQRLDDPGEGLGNDRIQQWENLTVPNYPFNGEPYQNDGNTYGYSVLPLSKRLLPEGTGGVASPVDLPAPRSVYLASVFFSGSRPSSEAKDYLNTVVLGMDVTEGAIAEAYGVSVSRVSKPAELSRIRGITVFEAILSGNFETLSDFTGSRTDLEALDALGRTPLMAALAAKDPVAVKALLDAGVNVNCALYRNETALMIALRDFDEAVATRILDLGANVDAVNPELNKNALVYALRNGKDKLALRVIDAGADARLVGTDGWDALMIAVRNDCFKSARKLLELNVPVNGVTPNGYATLMISAQYAPADISIEIAKRAGDLNLRSDDGWCALSIALRYSKPELAAYLLDAGCEIEAHTNTGWTPLMHALRYSTKELASRLLDKGAEVNVTDNTGWTPLMIALRYDRPEAAAAMIRTGAEVNAANVHGWTPLMFAIEYSTADNVSLLLDRAAGVNAATSLETDTGWSPLLLAARYGPDRYGKDLLDRGADVNYANKDGSTALTLACRYRGEDFALALIDAGATVTAVDKDGKTPLHWAVERRLTKAVTLLLQKGADPDVRDKNGVSPRNNAKSKGFSDIIDAMK